MCEVRFHVSTLSVRQLESRFVATWRSELIAVDCARKLLILIRRGSVRFLRVQIHLFHSLRQLKEWRRIARMFG